jgi:hypothetical protein
MRCGRRRQTAPLSVASWESDLDLRVPTPKVDSPKLSQRKEFSVPGWGLCPYCDQVMRRPYFPGTTGCINTEYQLDCITEYRIGGAL